MAKQKALTQKQLAFIKWYTSPASPTYDNAMQSAIKAGFSYGYAKSHASRSLKPLVKRVLDNKHKDAETEVDRSQFYQELLTEAENGIAERVKMKTKDPKMLQIQQKDQHLVAETIGKERWSKRTEVENTGKVLLPANTFEKLADTFLAAVENSAPKDLPRADYDVIDGQTVKNNTEETD